MLATHKYNYQFFKKCNLSSCIVFALYDFAVFAIALSRAHSFRHFSLNFSVTFGDKIASSSQRSY